ncbi:MAG: hypothetical protein KatS3mg035_1748 [Bacteroidia bacterium]|nr:MAG: hypothetical protein KatS3mg035_1748 [Bacteroidia bacterium]
MMKKAVFILFLLNYISLKAQYNVSVTYCNHNDVNASRYEPSELHLGKKHFQLSGNYYLWAGNNAFHYGLFDKLQKSKELTETDIENLLSSMHPTKNTLGIGQDYQILGLAFQIKNLAIAFSVVDKFAFDFNYTRNFLNLLWKGNKQFAGQNVDLGPISMNAQYTREFVGATAFNIIGDMEKGVRLGVRAKYIQGIGALSMPTSQLKMYTDPDGRYIDIGFNYHLNISGLSQFDPLKFNGTGYGADLGATFNFSPKFSLDASLLDIGAVTYTNNLKSYAKMGTYRYEGMFIKSFFGTPEMNTDSIASIFEPVETEGTSFSVALPTRLLLQGELKLGKKDEKSLQPTHSFFFTYIQGFNQKPGVVPNALISEPLIIMIYMNGWI